MQNSSDKQEKQTKVESVGLEKPSKKPDDRGSVQIDAHIKIYDPNSEQVYVEGRA
jgi:hypothetical protein